MLGNPTKKQQDFQDWARELGCITDNDHGRIAIHHIKGAKKRLKGVYEYGEYGEWYCFGICYYWHQDGSNSAAIHTNRKAFTKFWEMSEKEFWLKLMEIYKQQHDCYPMNDEEFQIIKDRG